MVIKTGICAFSEYRIYPGHGSSFVRRDGQLVTFINHKTRSLHDNKKKPAKLTWTTAWRRLNKKEQKGQEKKKRRRKTVKVQRPVVSASVDDIKAKRKEKKPEDKKKKAQLAELAQRKNKQKTKKI
eukprot:snap_masked-scaffold_29-processed-gene-1.26-mRNA-1 protein AED:0.13 eAED:0.13 QI:0/-1/0/1/-1/1/1/0/125